MVERRMEGQRLSRTSTTLMLPTKGATLARAQEAHERGRSTLCGGQWPNTGQTLDRHTAHSEMGTQ